MPSLYTDSLYTSLLLGLYDRSTSLTEVQINCVESGEPPWKTSAGTVGMRFEDSTVLPFDYQLYLIRTHFCLSTRTRKITRKNVTGNFWMVVYAHRNGPRLFNPVHVIELPQLASVWLSPYILSAAIRLAFCISVLGCFMSRCFRWTFFAPMGEKRRFLPGKRTEIQPSLGTEGAPRQANFRSGI